MPHAPFHVHTATSDVVGTAWRTGGLARILNVPRPQYLSGEDEQRLLAAVERAIGEQDLQYLSKQDVPTDDLRRIARTVRKRFLRLYLEQCRASFDASAEVARQFAADADSPELAFAVLRQTIRFRMICIALRFGLFLHPMAPVARLVELLGKAARPLEARRSAATQHAGIAATRDRMGPASARGGAAVR